MPAALPTRSALPRLLAAGRNRAEGDGPRHVHDAPELVLVREGVYGIALGERFLPGAAGTLFVLPPRVPHAVRSPGARVSSYLVFRQTAELLEESPRTLDARGDPFLPRWFDDLLALARADPRREDPVADGLLYAILQRVARLEGAQRAAPRLHPALERAVSHLQAHAVDRVGARDLARAAHASHGHLCRLFKEAFRCTPRAYQHRLRLERAKKLLLDPYLSVKEIAVRCGFEDVNYFVRLFRAREGRTPGRWRATASR